MDLPELVPQTGLMRSIFWRIAIAMSHCAFDTDGDRFAPEQRAGDVDWNGKLGCRLTQPALQPSTEHQYNQSDQ